jgi:YfiH family protein
VNPALLYPDWPSPPGVVAFTTTRLLPADADISTLLPPNTLVPRMRQVHGNSVVDADAAEGAEADAVHTHRAGVACVVATADCLPLLLCHRSGAEIAAVHAGWRGLAAGVIESTLARLSGDPGDFLAWLGPAISAARYEVGAEVREQMLAAASPDLRSAIDSCFESRGGGKYLADLPAIARARLAWLGCKAVYGGSECSYSHPQRYHSFRRDGEASGRMLSVISMTA